MKKRIKIIFCFIITLLIVTQTGCQSERELNQLVIVMGIGLDSDQQNPDNIKVIAQIVLPGSMKQSENGGSSGSSGKAYENVESSSSDTFDAVREYTHMLTGKLYIAHNQIFIISRAVAEKGMEQYMDFFIRAVETRPTAIIAISDTTAEAVLSVQSKLNEFPAINIQKLVEDSVSHSQTAEVNLINYINAMQSETVSFFAPMVFIEQNAEGTVASVKGLAVFSRDKMVGEFNEDETRGLLWVKGLVKSGVLKVTVSGGIASLEISGAQGSVSPSVEDGKVSMKITVSAKTRLGEQTGKEDLSTPEMTKMLEGLAEEKIENEITQAYTKAVSLGADVFGFGEQIHKYYMNDWRKMKDKWAETFPQIQLDMKINVDVTADGTITKPILSEKGTNNE